MAYRLPALRAVLLACCLGMAFAGASRAAPLQDLIATRVPVTDQSADALNVALKAAINQALVRMTGLADIAGNSLVAEVRKSPRQYLQQYHYERNEDQQIELVARFDAHRLRLALARLGIPTWQAERPPVLVWFAFDSGSEQELISQDTGQQPGEALHDAAADLGVEVIFPLMDLRDRQHVRYSDITGGFSQPVLAASQRYSTPLVLMLQVHQSQTGWLGRWVLYRDGAAVRWGSDGDRLEDMLSQGMQQLAASLRPDYTLLPDLTASTQMQIRIDGIDSLERYASAENLLAALPGVTAVHLRTIWQESARFQLVLDVSPSLVQRELDRNPGLASAAESAEQDSDSKTAPGDQSFNQSDSYRYRLIP